MYYEKHSICINNTDFLGFNKIPKTAVNGKKETEVLLDTISNGKFLKIK